MNVLNWSGFSKKFHTRGKEEKRRQREKRQLSRRTLLIERLDERTVLSSIAGMPNPNESVTAGFAADELAAALVGDGVTISNATLKGSAAQNGSFTFTDPTVVGFGQGIILSSGNAVDTVGPNLADWTSSTFPPEGDVWGAGDPDLDALSGYPTYDAAVLEFDFVPTANQVVFTYAFASDEYPEWVNTPFNDVFAFYVNGTDYATIRQVAGDPNSQFVPVAVNNINNGNPDYYPDFVPARPDLFRPNYVNPTAGPSAIDLELDGITKVLTFQAPVKPGELNHMKLAIADASDGIYDSAVFIQAGSLVSNENPVADLSLLPETGQAPLTVTAIVEGEDPNGAALTYTIAWGDDTFSSGPLNSPSDDSEKTTTVDHTYTTAGEYFVTLTVSNGSLSGTSTEDVDVLGTGSTVLDTLIISKPSDPSNDSTPSFTFSSTQVGSTFEYSLDGGVTFTACPSNLTITSPLADGTYTIEVRATNAGVTDATPASYTWTIDTTISDATAPDTEIVSKPADPSNDTAPTFTFSSTDPEGEFEYSLDGIDWEGCDDVLTLNALTDGEHTILVRSIDNSKNADPTPASYTWTVDTVAPETTITEQPVALSNDTTPTFSFAATESDVIFTYAIDGGNFVPGKSETTLNGLADGSHTIEVRATDAAGNVGPSVSYTWKIDTTPPQAPTVALTNDTGSSAADNITTDGALMVGGLEANAGLAYSNDGGATWTNAFLAQEGANTVQVRQTDLAGNESAVAVLDFTLDTAAPSAPGVALMNDTGSSPVDNITKDGALSVSAESAAKVEYSTDNGATWATAFSAPEGANTVQVRQTDLAGNVSGAAALSFTLDTTPPQLNPTFSSPSPFLVGAQGITVSPNATDASGVASQSAGTVDTSTAGQKSVTCSAIDVAGNTAAVSVPYSVIPAQNTTYNIVSTLPPYVISKHITKIPVLFQLRDANNQLISDQQAAKLLAGISITFDGVPMGKVRYHKVLNFFSATLKIGKPAKGIHDLAIHVAVDGTEVSTLTIPVKVV